MKCSVIMGTFQRRHLLERSLYGYLTQHMPKEDFELIILDDWSTDKTDELLQAWAPFLNIISIRPPHKEPGVWRDSAAILNIGLRASQGELIVVTHPEVIPGKDSLMRMWEHRQERTYHACKVYYLTPDNQRDLALYGMGDDPLTVRKLPGFYDLERSPEFTGHPDYTHTAMDRHTNWQSLVFGGGMRSYWQALGGFYEFKTWGSIDVWHDTARSAHGMECKTELDETTIVVHQNHDEEHARGTPTPRDMTAAMGALHGIPHTVDHVWR